MNYDMELDKIVNEIKKQKAKSVCLQLADGLKPKAEEIQDAIQKETDAQVMIWAGSCFGSCDIPIQITKKVDMLIHFGHSEWQ